MIPTAKTFLSRDKNIYKRTRTGSETGRQSLDVEVMEKLEPTTLVDDPCPSARPSKSNGA